MTTPDKCGREGLTIFALSLRQTLAGAGVFFATIFKLIGLRETVLESHVQVKSWRQFLGTIVCSSFSAVCAAKPDTHSRFRLTDEGALSENFPADEISFSLLV